ncbi:Diguanylate cyclase (GGDEF) domain-containing protein [Lysobacter dokdonensis DS-58]|uniref:diguanylate cyclase n=1 Tax=Lysobacter dokdonensis DS-58 TaxID=1300345 RepID=A0A0A2WJY4_9GAMM|nr:ligand-binding sensor domain-containing diguanylate cyclase [Lysobacter dokdonensis]KGQ19032.1 Diguanylate cyclase (GGDEF) domain-containing protein [Lysobacter dokdonensis DS-58]
MLAAGANAAGKPVNAYFRETWTTREGLPHNQVNAIAQSPDGYLWFGTWEGLVRYNGLEFHVIDRRNTPALRDNGIRSIRVAPDGALVVGTSRGGVSVLRDGAWRTYGKREGLAQEEVMDAVLDAKHRLWVATESAGFTRIDPDGRAHQYNQSTGVPTNITFGLVRDRDDSVWASTAAGVLRFVGDKAPIVYNEDDGLPNAPIFHLEQMPDGTLYAGTERGAYRRVGERFEPVSAALPADGVPSLVRDVGGDLWVGTINHGLLRLGADGTLDALSSQKGLPNNRVAALFVDREGSLWAGTNAGLLRLRDAPFTTFNTEQGLSDDYVRAIVEGRDGSIWIGTSRGLNRWKDGKVVDVLTSADGLPGDSILSLLTEDDDSLWVGTYVGGLLRLRDGKVVEHYDTGNGMPGSNQVRALAHGRDGSLWIGTSRGLVQRKDGRFRLFGAAAGLPRDFVLALHVARDGAVWVGTANGAARVIDDRVEPIDLHAMNDAQDVFDFHEDSDGSVWIATDRGLVRYRNGRIAAIGLAQGLPIDTLFQVVDDQAGSLWLTSNRGVLRVARRDAEAVLAGTQRTVNPDQFGEPDGLASSQANGGSGPAAIRDSKGRLWVATARGAAMVDPKVLHSYRRHLPPVVIEQVLADDRELPAQSRIVLPPGTRKLEFHYAGLSFQMPRLLRYRYRLEGVDAGWNERGNQRVAQYTNLAPGKYRFFVTSSAPGLGQGWNTDVTTLEIEIQRRFWQNAWFMALCGVGLLLLVLFYIRWRTRSLRMRALELERVVEERTRDLQRQAREDALTGLQNRRSLDERLAHAFDTAVRTQQPLSFALLDIDHFKHINDEYSHAAGDEALREVARVLLEALDHDALLARWGGEEFAVLFPTSTLEEARARCELARAAIENLNCDAFAPGWRMTLSGGVCDRTGLAHHERLVRRADQLLYEAKRAGRNRIVG